MSSIVLKGSTSGDVTVQAPAVATGTVTMPSATGTLLTTTGDGSSLTSLTGSQIDSGQTTCKAWVNFDGSGTVSINDSYNVSSITDNGTGDYTVNLSITMANTNYCAVAHAQYGGGNNDTMVVQMPAGDRAVGSVGCHLMIASNNATTFSNNIDTVTEIIIFGD